MRRTIATAGTVPSQLATSSTSATSSCVNWAGATSPPSGSRATAGPSRAQVRVRALTGLRTEQHVALKIVRSAESYTETAQDEIKLLQRLAAADGAHPGYAHVLRILDHFTHRSAHGAHVCMIFEVLGESLMGLIDTYLDRGVPLNVVKQVAKQLLLALDYMHRAAGLIHTDLKPENVLICVDDVERCIRDDLARNPPEAAPTKFVRGPSGRARGRDRKRLASDGDGEAHLEEPERAEVYITASQPLPSPKGGYEFAWETGGAMTSLDASIDSLANLSLSPSPSSSGAQSPAADIMLPPPVIQLDGRAPVGRQASTDNNKTQPPGAVITVKIADVGNATPIEKHFSDDIQTRQYRSPEVIMGAKWGPSVDIWSAACIIFELITGGDILFQPVASETYSKDDDHLAQIVELCGNFPRAVTHGAYFERDFFNSRGELRNIHSLRYWPLEDVLREKYLFSRPRAKEIAAFLKPMLDLDPNRRATAEEMLRHPWLDGVVVKGELEAACKVVERVLRDEPPTPSPGPMPDMDAPATKKTIRTENGGGGGKKKKKKKR
ncbi:kinase-like protein [Exidia glandulosa HHB12029]|uniref:non-specific serine/threonine protein kinase n=1 Tax=Exidia glandulosa HHB12029 TaxID=1314781 RepID=A0A165J2J8_EXIGL|nr:kinase-like protein [Exidia glandulosa HHB12029]